MEVQSLSYLQTMQKDLATNRGNPDDLLQLAKPDKAAIRQSEIQQNLEWLQRGVRTQRKSAIARLGLWRAAPEEILLCLGDSDLELRLEAINALANFEAVSGDLRSEMVQHLAGALNDPDSRVIAAAVRSLGMLHAQEAIPEIRDLLEEKDTEIVHMAIVALARLEDHASLENILSFLDSRSNYLKQAAWQAVGILNYTPAIPALLSQMRSSLEKRPLSHAALNILLQYIEVCKQLKVTAAIPLLVQIVRTESALRIKAISALARMEIETFPEELLALLDDPNPHLRSSVLKLMRQTGCVVPQTQIYKLLNDELSEIRLGTLDYVCQIGAMESVGMLRFMCYREPAPRVRVKAISALVHLTGVKALADLYALAFDPKLAIRSAVASSLGDLPLPLPPRAGLILEHLHNVPETREMIESILQKLPGQTLPAGLPASPELCFPFPEQGAVTRQEFLNVCVEWHTALGQAALGSTCPDEAFAVQSALSSLIASLSRK